MRTSEMIAMLEKNPKLKFISQNRYIAGVNERTGLFTWERQEGTSGFNNNLRLLPSGGGKPDDWTLIHEPVPVWEAIKAWMKDHARIRCEYDGEEYFFDKDTLFKTTITWELIYSGTWYIEDPAYE